MAGRPKKIVEDSTEEVVGATAENNRVDTEKDDLKSTNQELLEMIKNMKQEIDNLKKVQSAPAPIIIKDSGSGAKKIKCVSLVFNEINVATGTESDDRHKKIYNFKNHGDTKNISFDDLSDIVAAYPYTMGNGLIYICDKDAVEELGLSEEYKKLYTAEKIEEISNLSTDLDVDFFVNMEENLRDSVAQKMANGIKTGVFYDRNRLASIKSKCGVDIEQIAKDLEDIDKVKA